MPTKTQFSGRLSTQAVGSVAVVAVEYTAKSNTGNRIPGTNCIENAVSGIGFRGGIKKSRLLNGPRYRGTPGTRT
eukprot:279440-Rhodomonas_salina.1